MSRNELPSIPAQHQSLRKAYSPGPLANVAIGEQEGVATLHVPTHDLKCSSLQSVGGRSLTPG